jgi:ferredoxin
MTYVVVEPCISVKDTACIDVCPMDCIHCGEKDQMVYIDPEECIDCDACVAECPVDAIFPEAQVPEKWKHFIQINADYFK